MHSVTISSGKHFVAQEGETLLDAALRHGITLDYSCRTGRCSSCKAKVRQGSTTALKDETGLSAAEQAQGYILTCARGACGAVDLEVNDLGDIQLPESRTVPCRIHSIERLAPDVVRVMLRLPPASPLTFLAGQYVDVIGPEGVRRSYSLANGVRPDGQLELHVRAVTGGVMTRYWFEQAKPNDLLRLRGPMGTFFLRDHAGKHLVFLATGTGIAPVKSILEDLAAQDGSRQPLSVTVYWGGRQPEDLYWPVPESPGVRFVPVLSRADDRWAGARGHVQDVLLQATPDLAHTLVYACGSDAMIHSAQARLREAGLPDAHFHSDAFVCSAAT